MEHIRALIDGLLITLPGSIVMGLPVSYMILTVILYMCLNANKLYMNMLADVEMCIRDRGRRRHPHGGCDIS